MPKAIASNVVKENPSNIDSGGRMDIALNKITEKLFSDSPFWNEIKPFAEMGIRELGLDKPIDENWLRLGRIGLGIIENVHKQRSTTTK